MNSQTWRPDVEDCGGWMRPSEPKPIEISARSVPIVVSVNSSSTEQTKAPVSKADA